MHDYEEGRQRLGHANQKDENQEKGRWIHIYLMTGKQMGTVGRISSRRAFRWQTDEPFPVTNDDVKLYEQRIDLRHIEQMLP